jgi:single-strand DNA-binding protein
MSGVNKVILIGNLGADPEVRYTQDQKPVVNFRLATSENWTGRDGQRQERTEWHRVVCYDRLAETCKDYLVKGKQVYVEGRLQTRSWEAKDGQKRYTTEVVAAVVRFLGQAGGERPARAESAPAGGSMPQGEPPMPPEDEDDLPF